jgi:hypothetical protein
MGQAPFLSRLLSTAPRLSTPLTPLSRPSHVPHICPRSGPSPARRCMGKGPSPESEYYLLTVVVASSSSRRSSSSSSSSSKSIGLVLRSYSLGYLFSSSYSTHSTHSTRSSPYFPIPPTYHSSHPTLPCLARADAFSSCQRTAAKPGISNRITHGPAYLIHSPPAIIPNPQKSSYSPLLHCLSSATSRYPAMGLDGTYSVPVIMLPADNSADDIFDISIMEGMAIQGRR